MAYVAQSTPEDASPPSTPPSEAGSQAGGARSGSKDTAEAGEADPESASESKGASSTDENDTDSDKDAESSERSTDDDSESNSDKDEDEDNDEDKDKDDDEDEDEDEDDEATSTTDIDPRLPPGGINMITPAPLSGSQYYKIGDYVTFGWNYTSLSVTPKSIDVMASCSLNNQLYTIAVNQSVESSQMVVWDTEAESTNSAPPPMYVLASVASARERPSFS